MVLLPEQNLIQLCLFMLNEISRRGSRYITYIHCFKATRDLFSSGMVRPADIEMTIPWIRITLSFDLQIFFFLLQKPSILSFLKLRKYQQAKRKKEKS